MDEQTNGSYSNLIDPVLRAYGHERPTVDTLEGNREDLLKVGNGSQGACLLQLHGGLVDITKVLGHPVPGTQAPALQQALEE